MSEVGDPNTELKSKDQYHKKMKKRNLEVKPSKIQPQRNLLLDAQKSIVFLEHQSMVDFIETVGEFIISAGRDHDINVWDAQKGKHILRLSGHSGPVTGLGLCTVGQETSGTVLVSSSEDGTLRQWSWELGKELKRFETGDLITCMSIINNVLAVTGDHKGYMVVHHLSSGDLYSKILAHEDPVDALAVEGNYACSATFDAPSCLKVWEIRFEQTICIYRIENTLEIDFSSLAIRNSLVFLGASNEQKLHVINFKTDEKGLIDLERQGGRVQCVKVWNSWILSCSVHKREAVIDVHRINTYEYYGTFSCNIQHVLAMAAIENESSLRIAIGGSALIVLSFDFIVTPDDRNISSNRTQKKDKLSFVSKSRGYYTLKTTAAREYPEDSTDFEENDSSSDDDTNYSIYKNISSPQPNIDFYSSVIQPNIENQADINTEYNANIPAEKQLTNEELRARMMSINPVMSSLERKLEEESLQCFCEEPRVAVRKLETLLDEELYEPDILLENIKKYQPSKELSNDNLNEYQKETEYDMNREGKEINTEVNLDNSVTENINTKSTLNESEPPLSEMINKNNEMLEKTELATGDNATVDHARKKFICLKTKKSKSEKCKESKKHKLRRCEIM